MDLENINKIYCGNCLEVIDILDNESLDLVLFSPPYDDSREYDNKNYIKKELLIEVYRKLEDKLKFGGVILNVINDKVINNSRQTNVFKLILDINKETNLIYHDMIIFVTNGLVGIRNQRLTNKFHYIPIIRKGGLIKTFNIDKVKIKSDYEFKNKINSVRKSNGDTEKFYADSQEFKNPGNVLFFDSGFNRSSLDKISYNHPATYPEELCKFLIKLYSNENDIVLDPFLGSGTTAKIALQLKRYFIGCEISQKYIDEIIRIRLNQIDEKINYVYDYSKQTDQLSIDKAVKETKENNNLNGIKFKFI